MYNYLEHEADMGILGIGETIEEAFAEGARGMYDIMVDIDKIDEEKEMEFSVSASSLEYLFVEFLNELLSITGIKNMVFRKFDVSINKNVKYELNCVAYGEILKKEKHNVKTEVKGATYSGLEYWEKNGKHYIQCIVDV